MVSAGPHGFSDVGALFNQTATTDFRTNPKETQSHCTLDCRAILQESAMRLCNRLLSLVHISNPTLARLSAINAIS